MILLHHLPKILLLATSFTLHYNGHYISQRKIPLMALFHDSLTQIGAKSYPSHPRHLLNLFLVNSIRIGATQVQIIFLSPYKFLACYSYCR